MLFIIFACLIRLEGLELIKYKGTQKIWILIVLIVIVVAGWTWSYCSHNRKSNDNLPNLQSIAQMDEAEVNKILSGYRRTQLSEVWGVPAYSDSSEDV